MPSADNKLSPPRVAIVGRPNVGKSTLFNRLVGRRRAIVDDTPGVTRDVREAPAQLGDLAFTLLDTAGWETTGGEALEARMRRFTERAIEGSDVVLFLIDARAGVLPMDESFAGWLRKRADKVIVVANKCEGRIEPTALEQPYNPLGLIALLVVRRVSGDHRQLHARPTSVALAHRAPLDERVHLADRRLNCVRAECLHRPPGGREGTADAVEGLHAPGRLLVGARGLLRHRDHGAGLDVSAGP